MSEELVALRMVEEGLLVPCITVSQAVARLTTRMSVSQHGCVQRQSWAGSCDKNDMLNPDAR